jgi:uncharacterized protein YndB with AHSA1/START domain
MNTRSQEIIITRLIRASPEQIFAAFTKADGWCRWCCETAEVDARVGGKLHIYTEGYNAYGEFTGLEPDRRVAFSWNGDKEPPTLIEIQIIKHDTQAELTFRATGICSEQDWAGIADFLEHIWGHVLDNLKTVLEGEEEG